jgi:uncharacterized membrane protein YjfL (UPF0719 family)
MPDTPELIGQVLAYTGVGLGVLLVGFFVLDLLTPGSLGKQVMDGNMNAAVLTASSLFSLGLILWFAIFFTGKGWDGLDEAAIFGAVGVAAQAAGFVLLDLLTPGKLRVVCMGGSKLHPATIVDASVQFAVALVICASLT